MYRNLSRLFKNVGDCLDDIFDFNAEGHSATIIDMNEENDRERFKRLVTALNMNMEIYERALEKEQCLYTGHIGDGELGYVITIPRISMETPATLGEETTHGEHHIHHEQSPEYRDRFHEPTREFIGFLGMQHVADEYGLSSTVEPNVIHDMDFDESELNHDIGYVIASQIINYMNKEDIPYRDIFHSRNQQDVWKIVNGIMIPRPIIPVSEEVEKDALIKIVREKIDSMGLKAKIELYPV